MSTRQHGAPDRTVQPGTFRNEPTDGNNRRRRYSTIVVKRAQSLAGGGWTAHEITKLFNGEGIPVSFATVKAWIDPDYRRVRNHISCEDQRRMRDISGLHVRKRMLELHHAGLGPSAISVVVKTYHGRTISPEMVRNYIKVSEQRAEQGATA